MNGRQRDPSGLWEMGERGSERERELSSANDTQEIGTCFCVSDAQDYINLPGWVLEHGSISGCLLEHGSISGCLLEYGSISVFLLEHGSISVLFLEHGSISGYLLEHGPISGWILEHGSISEWVLEHGSISEWILEHGSISGWLLEHGSISAAEKPQRNQQFSGTTTSTRTQGGTLCKQITSTSASRVAQRYKILHLSARDITTDPCSIPGCITIGCDWESHRAAHNSNQI